jgi:RNA polymerase sigma factor (TIGR02999 family)
MNKNETNQNEITAILNSMEIPNEKKWAQIIPIIYPRLMKIAHNQLLNSSVGDTMDTSALVHESFMYLNNINAISWKDRRHFFLVTSQIMKQIVISRARYKKSQKRGNGVKPLPLNPSVEALIAPKWQDIDFDFMEEALEELKHLEKRIYDVVHLRFFVGLNETEIAELYGVSNRTIIRDWIKAKHFLAHKAKN